jgi:hypothetical protein
VLHPDHIRAWRGDDPEGADAWRSA